MPRKFSSFGRLVGRFIHTESASSIVLAISTLVAMALANSFLAAAYLQLLEIKILGLSLQHWINDGLMAIFFFVVGMEVKREIVAGELSSIRKAALPVSAAIGGMIVPAAIYILMNPHGAAARGWAIPMATDIAFALGVLTLLGKRVPLSLKIFLLALAIVDDLGAIFVIATFYSNEIRETGIYIASFAALAIVAARAIGLRRYLAYVPLGIILWIGILYSGVHATIAGVIVGLLTPSNLRIERGGLDSVSPIDDLIYKLHPWVSFGIMPIFALANAGIPIAGATPAGFFGNSISMGVFLGLLLGKPIGILLASMVAIRSGLASLPQDFRWLQLAGVSCLAGIGFTMAIFITNLSLAQEQASNAKVAIIGASSLSAALGFFILKNSLKRLSDEVKS